MSEPVTLNPQQFAQFMAAFNAMAGAVATTLAGIAQTLADATAAQQRAADAIQGVYSHLDPKGAAKTAAPGYLRPLGAYKSFNWASINADVIAFDRDGATEVEHNGQAYRRYASREDDPRGMDIRFRRVVSGTPETKDMQWTTLIKFADRRAKPAPRKLAADVAEAAGAPLQAGSGSGRTIDATPKTRTVTVSTPRPAVDPAVELLATVATLGAPDPVDLPPLSVTADPVWIAGDVVRRMLQDNMTKMNAARDPSAGTRQNVFLTLRHVAGDEDAVRAFCGFVFGHNTYKNLSGRCIWALQAWLKPAPAAGVYAAANADATAQAAAVLAAGKLEDAPAPVAEHAAG